METIKEAKQFLRENFQQGCNCPACGQYVKLYKRKITSSMAYGLILFYKESERTNGAAIHIEDYFKSLDIPSSIRGDFSKLKFWNLIERSHLHHANHGAKNSGVYKITGLGKAYVLGMISLPKFALVYNDFFNGFEGKEQSITEALGDKFNYQELMS